MALNPWRTYLTTLDRWLVSILTLLVCGSFLLPLQGAVGERLIISQGGEIVYVAELGQPGTIEISGPLGTTLIEVADHGCRVLSSPCPQKICIGLGQARHQGDLLACVPNGVVIRVEGGNKEDRGYDLLSR